MIGVPKKIVFAGALGNALEWYDFTIYAFFVPIFAKQFFPNQDPFISLLATFGVFAVGFLVRPLGAVLFGYIGDHAGRKKALVISMIMMSFPTFLIGALPNYSTIGIMAPLLLIILRIIQGLAVSGELTTATVFLIEHADSSKRGIAGSLAMVGALFGMVLSSVFATAMSKLVSEVDLATWGWRVPFLLGGVVGIIGLVVRLRSVDPAVFERIQENGRSASIFRHLSSLNYKTLFVGICLTSIMAISNYFLIAYFNTFLTETQDLPLKSVMMVNAAAITIQAVVTLLMGRLSDYLGRKMVLGAGIVGLLVLVQPIFWLLCQKEIHLVFLGESLFALCAGTLTGLIPTTLAEMFDTYHRNMGISISYNISLALFGGTAPLVAISLVAITNNVFTPAYYFMACALIALCALLTLQESYRKSFLVAT